MAFLDKLLEKIKKPLQALPDWAKKSPVQVASDYFKPTSNQGQNFWSTPTAQKLGEAQTRIKTTPLKQYFFPTASGAAPETFRRYVGDTGKTAWQTAKQLPKAALGLAEMTTPGLPLYRALAGQQDKTKRAASNVASPALSALGLKYRTSPLAPVMGSISGGIKEARGDRPLLQAMKEEGFGWPSKEQLHKTITGGIKGITEQPGIGEALSDNPTTQTILNMAYLVGMVFGPKVYKNMAQKKAIDKERAALAKTLGISSNASEAQAKGALQDFAQRWHPDLHYGKPTYQQATQKMTEINNSFQRLQELGFGTGAPSAAPPVKSSPKTQPVTATDKQLAPVLLQSGKEPALSGIVSNKPSPSKTTPPKPPAEVTEPLSQETETELLPWETKKQDIPILGYQAGKTSGAASDSTRESLVQSEIDERIAKAEIGQEYGPKGVKKLLNRLLNPLKNAPEPVQQSANTWRKEVLTARTDANALASKFGDIPAEDGWKMVRYIENPTTQTAQKLGFDPAKYQKQIKDIRQVYDQVREEGLKKGLDIGYLDNYLNHVWEESWGEIATKVRGAGARPYFTKERVIPSLEEGMELGLHPKFTHPAQFVAHYKEALGKAVANKKLVDSLVENGQLVPAGDAPLDWQSINAPLFPKVTKIIDGKKQIISDYKAPPNVAEAVNSIFEFGSGQHSGLEVLAGAGANVSKKLQEVSLSGGVGPANAFTYGQVLKEVTSGRAKSPITSFFRAWSDKGSKQFFSEKQPVVRMMNEEGIPVYHTGDYKKMFTNLAQNKTLKQKLGGLWDKALNEPTFRRFMPMLEVNFFEDTYNNAIKSGLSEIEARKLAGEATKNFYGIADNFARSKFVDDTISTAFFAPTFRESMVNFWINNAKALSPKNLGDKAYNANRKFLAGIVLTYLFYNAANRALTGHSMSENKGGKELSVEIPVGDNRSIYVPMLPSVGTLPRRAGEMTGALLEGDVRTATQKAGSLLSSPISLGSQLATNRTFYGGKIYQDDDPALKKITQLGGYAFEQASPAYMGEPMAYFQGRKTPLETALGMMEMPAYPSSSTPEKPLPLANVAATQTLAAGDNTPLATTGTQEKPSFLESLFSLKRKDEPQELRPLPQQTGDLAIIFGEAQKTLEGYEEKRVKAEYGQYESEKKRQDALTKLEEDRAYAQAVLERIKSEKPEQVFDIGLQTYASGAGPSVEKRAEWAAGELNSATGEEEFAEKIDQMLEAKVLTKDVVDMLREEYGLPVNRYTSGGKIKTIGGSGRSSSASSGSLSKILAAARQDAQDLGKLYASMPTSQGSPPSALEAVLRLHGQSRATSAPTASSLEAILAQKRRMEPIARIG